MSAAQQNWAEADSDDENHGRGGNDRRDQYPQNDSYQQSRQREPRPPTTAADVPMQGPFVAFIGNLPFSAVENDIGDYFHNGGCDVKDVMIKMGDDGRPRGMALVEFANRESLVKALSANGTNMMGRDIRVDVDMKRPARSSNMGGRREDRGDRDGGGRRDDRDGGGRRDDRDRDRGDRGDEADRWARAPRQEQPSESVPRSSSYRQAPVSDRPSHNRRPDARDDRGGSSDAGDGALVIPTSTTRPIIKIQPRTLPVETLGQPVAAAQSIFGGAKPRDEKAYEEERKKKLEAERVVAERTAAEKAEKAEKEGKVVVETVTSSLAATSITEGDKTAISVAVATTGAAADEPKWSNYPPERDGGRGRGAGRGQGQQGTSRGPPPVKQQQTR